MDIDDRAAQLAALTEERFNGHWWRRRMTEIAARRQLLVASIDDNDGG
jgi:hypothetical protein